MVHSQPLRSLIGAAMALVALAVGCTSSAEGSGGCVDTPPAGPGSVATPWDGPGPAADPSAVWPVDPRTAIDTRWGIEVLAEIPHDRAAFTQGLEFHDGRLLESTGCRGQSEVREVDPYSGEVRRSSALDVTEFGEGLTVVDDQIIQLTWQAGIARRLDAETFEPVGEHTYSGEGWGLCADGDIVVMSNGSATLTIRNPVTFGTQRAVRVLRNDAPISGLNELECVDGLVLANVRRTDEILVIDPADGTVLATIDAPELRERAGTDKTEEVLNGIAAVGDGTLLLGGKHWPRHFIVRLTAD